MLFIWSAGKRLATVLFVRGSLDLRFSPAGTSASRSVQRSPSSSSQREANHVCERVGARVRRLESSLWIRTSALRLRVLRLKFSNTRRGHSYFSGNGDRRTVTGERKADITWFLQLDRRIDAARRLCQSRSTVRLLGPEKAPTA